METLMFYFVKVNIIFTILFTAYFFLFKTEKTFYLNRAFLLSSLLLSLLLPLIPAIHIAPARSFPGYVASISPIKNVLGAGPTFQNGSHAGAELATHDFAVEIFSNRVIIQVFMSVYLVVALVLLSRVIYQLLNLYSLFKRSKRHKRDAIIYCEHNENSLPFSFFNFLFINPGSNYQNREQIIEHEKVHIRQWHSLDILLAEVFSVVTWINPLAVFLKRYIRLNLEYIADHEVLATGVDKKQYQLCILKNSINPNIYQLANLFSSSKTKLRIKMINQSKPTRKWYKYLLVLPLVLISYLLVNPVTATPENIKPATPAETPLKAFEGIYRNHIAPTAYFKVKVVNNALVVDRLDYKQQVVLNRRSDLAFEGLVTGTGKKMTVVFSKNNADAISQLSIDKRTQWIKVSARKVVDQVKLPPAMLKKFEGEYQLERDPGTLLTITSNGTGLMLKQKWDGQERGPFVPTSYVKFLLLENAMPLRFAKDNEGNVAKMYASGSDVWDKVKE